MTYLYWLLLCFKALSGLKINLEKSELILVGCVDNVQVLAADLGCRWGSCQPLTLECLWVFIITHM